MIIFRFHVSKRIFFNMFSTYHLLNYYRFEIVNVEYDISTTMVHAQLFKTIVAMDPHPKHTETKQ